MKIRGTIHVDLEVLDEPTSDMPKQKNPAGEEIAAEIPAQETKCTSEEKSDTTAAKSNEASHTHSDETNLDFNFDDLEQAGKEISTMIHDLLGEVQRGLKDKPPNPPRG